jgi:hypothetical protein
MMIFGFAIYSSSVVPTGTLRDSFCFVGFAMKFSVVFFCLVFANSTTPKAS